MSLYTNCHFRPHKYLSSKYAQYAIYYIYIYLRYFEASVKCLKILSSLFTTRSNLSGLFYSSIKKMPSQLVINLRSRKMSVHPVFVMLSIGPISVLLGTETTSYKANRLTQRGRSAACCASPEKVRNAMSLNDRASVVVFNSAIHFKFRGFLVLTRLLSALHVCYRYL